MSYYCEKCNRNIASIYFSIDSKCPHCKSDKFIIDMEEIQKKGYSLKELYKILVNKKEMTMTMKLTIDNIIPHVWMLKWMREHKIYSEIVNSHEVQHLGLPYHLRKNYKPFEIAKILEKFFKSDIYKKIFEKKH